jgi:hypothetical protein
MCKFEITADGKQLTFAAWDAQTGRGRELARVRDEHADNLRWDLSLDGSLIAVSDGYDSFRLVSLNHEPVQQLGLRRGAHLRSWVWAADGKGLLPRTLCRRVRSLSALTCAHTL